MIILIIAGLIPSLVLGFVVAKLKQSWIRGVVTGAILQCCWTVGIITLLILNGDPAAPGARTITKEELELLGASPEQNIRQVSPESAPSASPDELSM